MYSQPKTNGEQWSGGLEQAKETLLTDQMTAEYKNLINRTVFKGTSVRIHDGETVDWRLPFSDTLPAAIFTDQALQEQLMSGSLETPSTDAGMTDFGKELQQVLKDHVLMDMGCGAEQSTIPKNLAKIFNSSAYVGVDKYDGFVERQEPGKPPCMYIKGDILDIVARLARKGRTADDLVLLLSGIELSMERLGGFDASVSSEQYAATFREELNRLKPAAVVIAAGTSNILRPDERVFRLVASKEIYSSIGITGDRDHQIWVPKTM